MKLQITININADDVQRINESGQRITFVKSMTYDPTEQMTWLTFSPFEQSIVTWEPSYYLFGSYETIAPGAKIHQMSRIAAQEMFAYVFKDGVFTGHNANRLPGSYFVDNQEQDMVFGLAQAAVINDEVIAETPVVAVTALLGETMTFTPTETVLIFVSRYTDQGLIIPAFPENVLTVSLNEKQPSAVVSYVGDQFVLSN